MSAHFPLRVSMLRKNVFDPEVFGADLDMEKCLKIK
jgi:hypothetical protein